MMTTTTTTTLRPDELHRVARYVELDTRDCPLTSANIERVIQHGARQGDALYRRVQDGSDAQHKRLVAAVRTIRKLRFG